MASKPILATSAGSSFFACADLGVQHVGALEELGLGRARHQAGHGDAGVLQLVAQREGEGVDERLGAVVDRLEGARHEAGDRAGDQDAALAARAHVAADLLDQVDRAGDVGVDDVAAVVEVLVEEALPRPCPALASSASTGRPPIGRVERVDALDGREIGLDRLDRRRRSLRKLAARRCSISGSSAAITDRSRARRMLGQFEADAGRGAGDDGERACQRMRVFDALLAFASSGFSTTLMQPSFLSRNVL